jgi:hypothetical protein
LSGGNRGDPRYGYYKGGLSNVKDRQCK